MVVESDKGDHGTEEKCLLVLLLCIYGIELYVSMGLCATPNVISPRVVKKRLLKLEGTKK